MARYLDISFGLLAFSSSLALMYGAFVDSKSWIAVWTLGSATVLVGCWVSSCNKNSPQGVDEQCPLRVYFDP
jgi:hypothetical protein